MDEDYQSIGALFGIIAGVVTWVAAIVSWGFLLGVGFGWIPAIVVGVIVAMVWPVIALALLAAAVFFVWMAMPARSSTDSATSDSRKPSSSNADLMEGSWSASVRCAGAETKLVLLLRSEGNGKLGGQLSYFVPGTGNADRVARLFGGVDSGANFYLPETEWTRGGANQRLAVLSGTLTDSQSLKAKLSACDEVSVEFRR